MREVELKAVVADWDATVARLQRAGAELVFDGHLADRRLDTVDRALTAKDMVLRLRSYTDDKGTHAELGWKGPTGYEGGYKVREERETRVASPEVMVEILVRLGYVVTHAVDRRIVQYRLYGAVVRLERYPRMDDLIEVEGPPDAIERAIAVLGIPRSAFTSERLRDFAARFRTRTGQQPALSQAEQAGLVTYNLDDA
ncbi:MAG TPA: class IV adenylate cyclase [Gemmatimonadaceae bacterium]|nr:class IV adenylate cyclase [Gemmatimonadaceae bacterium]